MVRTLPAQTSALFFPFRKHSRGGRSNGYIVMASVSHVSIISPLISRYRALNLIADPELRWYPGQCHQDINKQTYLDHPILLKAPLSPNGSVSAFPFLKEVLSGQTELLCRIPIPLVLQLSPS